MPQKLTDAIVKALPAPATGNRIHYDAELKGFGCRVTGNGARSFILNYRTRAGRERRYTIGEFPGWKTAAARNEAAEWKRRIRNGGDLPVKPCRKLSIWPAITQTNSTARVERD